jgi:hypothetical protein
MGRKELECGKKYFMCDLKLLVQWDCYKSVARIRLVKTENPCRSVKIQ